MDKITLSELASFCNGELIGEDINVTELVRDNREVCGGELFIAIRGEKFDGHMFVSDAVKKGAAAVLVSQKNSGVSVPQIVAGDTLSALCDIAEGYRDKMPARRVCVTGSVGKTTTKEMIASVLSAKYKTHKTYGNYNNQIGLPLTILGMSEADGAAVLEIGTNHFGEILPLAKLACPEIVVITNIGDCHLEAFGSKDGVLREKLDSLKGLSKGGVAVLNGDDPLLWSVKDALSCKVIWYGIKNADCDIFGVVEAADAHGTSFSVRGSETVFSLNCGGEHNVINALAALAVGRILGVSDAEAADKLLHFKNTGMRQDIYTYNGITIIRDCYNASPDSMRAALSLLKKMKCKGRRVAVLGDMLELGAQSEKLHLGIGQFAAGCADKLFVQGRFAENYREGAGNKASVFSDKETLSKAIAEYLDEGDVLLVKGSYGTKMWQVLESLQKERV